LWEWLSVARWLRKNGKLDERAVAFAELIHDLNLHLEQVEAEPGRRKAIERLLATA
jgi:hypothetical protein